jgi:hypothetical protein
MPEKFKPSADFVAKVMARVYDYEDSKVSPYQWFVESRPLRYILAGGGTVFGVLTAIPVF